MGLTTDHKSASRVTRAVCLLLATQLLAACPARTAVKVATKTTGAVVKTTGAVVGGTVGVLTFSAPGPS